MGTKANGIFIRTNIDKVDLKRVCESIFGPLETATYQEKGQEEFIEAQYIHASIYQTGLLISSWHHAHKLLFDIDNSFLYRLKNISIEYDYILTYSVHNTTNALSLIHI